MAGGAGSSASVLVSLDLEISKFWQNRQPNVRGRDLGRGERPAAERS
jgi:hypothetical protein